MATHPFHEITSDQLKLIVARAHRPATFFFGSGLSSLLSDRHFASTWPGLIQAVSKEWEKHVKDSPPEVTAPGWTLTKSGDSDCLVAAAYILRRQMSLHDSAAAATASLSSLKTFATAVQEAVQQLCAKALNDLSDGCASREANLIAQALSNLGSRVRARKARLLTTNYDDLIAHLADLRVLLLDGRYFRPASRSTGTSPITEFVPDYSVPESKRRFQIWDQIDLCSAAPAQSASVLHLHGWHGQADSIVIDPVDYSEITTTDQDRRDKVATMVRQCNDTVANCMREGPFIYVGTAWGMVDAHLEMLRQQARSSATPPFDLTQTNFWIVNEKHDAINLETWFKRMGQNSASIVMVKNPQEVAELLLEITCLL